MQNATPGSTVPSQHDGCVPREQATRPFRFGVVNESPAPLGDWLAHVREVEALGYNTFLIRDHVIDPPFGPQYAPLVALAMAAAATTRLRVGTLVLSNDFRHPVLLAKELATLDALSGGRLEIGIGAGWLRAEYDGAGWTFDRPGLRIERLAESLTILRGLLSGNTVTFEGAHYQVRGLQTFPLPTQRPMPPLLVGGGNPRMLRLAGREADMVSMLTTSVASGEVRDDPSERTVAAVERKLGWIREGAGERFQQIELNLIPTLIPTDDPQRAAADLIAQRGWEGVSVDDVLQMPSLLFGGSDMMVQTLRARRERFGFSYYVVSDGDLHAFAPVVAALAGQ